MNISFMLSLNFLICLIFCVKYIETKDVFGINFNIEVFSIWAYFFVFCCEALLLVYFEDLYFISLILLFKGGVVWENLNLYNRNNKFTLVYFILSLVSLIKFSLYLSIKRKKEKEEKDINQWEDNYKNRDICSTDSQN